MKISRISFLSVVILSCTIAAESQYLQRSLQSANEFRMGLSAPSAHYFAMFGKGDDSSSVIKGLIRYGNLIVDPDGKSETAEFQDEEQVAYVVEGTGMITCYNVTLPVSMNDFIYIPA